MISREEFKRAIQTIQDLDRHLEELYALGVDFVNDSFIDSVSTELRHILSLSVNDTDDTIGWFLYDCKDVDKPRMWDKDGNVIPMKTLDDLYNYFISGSEIDCG